MCIYTRMYIYVCIYIHMHIYMSIYYEQILNINLNAGTVERNTHQCKHMSDWPTSVYQLSATDLKKLQLTFGDNSEFSKGNIYLAVAAKGNPFGRGNAPDTSNLGKK